MRLRAMPVVLILAGMMALSGASAQAQSSESTAPSPAAQPQNKPARTPAEIDFGVSFYEALNSTSSGSGLVQTPENSPGGLFEVRYIASPLVGFEFAYGFNPAKESFYSAADCATYHDCYTGSPAYTEASPLKLTAYASTVSLNWVFSRQIGSLRPFAVTGLGFFIDSTDPSLYNVNTVVRPAFVVGGGLDWSLRPRWGLRVQYRSTMYSAPNLSTLYPSTGILTSTSEPMAGFYHVF